MVVCRFPHTIGGDWFRLLWKALYGNKVGRGFESHHLHSLFVSGSLQDTTIPTLPDVAPNLECGQCR